MILPCDPRAGYLAQKVEIDAAVLQVLTEGRYILGAEVEDFEKEFASFIGTGCAVGVGSGTDALQLALRALGIGHGDCVFTVSHTAVATVAAIEMAGATAVLVDVDSDTFTMCSESLEQAVKNCGSDIGTPRAIVPVHLYGHPCDMISISRIARQYGMEVIEDCSQSHGAAIDGRMSGTFGKIGVFSLYPTKNLGAFGDAGVLVTDDREIAERLRMLRQYGWRERNCSELVGINSRLDELQAAVLRVRLRRLELMNEARREIASLYNSGLARTNIRLPWCSDGATHVYHQYVIRVSCRDKLQEQLRSLGISTMIHYPVPVHEQPAYRNRLPRTVDMPNTECLVREILSLPMYPELPHDQVAQVVDAITSLF